LPAADWLPLGLWLDGSIIILFVGHGGIGSCPIFSVDNFRLLPFGGSWRIAAHAYTYYSHKENVFGEWVFGFQRAVPFCHNGKQVKGFLSPFTCLLTQPPQYKAIIS
jgi:hypothetical protein